MHSRNLHRNGYNFTALANTHPPLQSHLTVSPVGKTTIDFANPEAVKALNAALLAHHYNTPVWDIPTDNLCPPIPGRADYIHNLADLLQIESGVNRDKSKQISGLDIGVGANMIYPILGSQIYGWKFVGSDISDTSLKSARLILNANPAIKKKVRLRQQPDQACIFNNIIKQDDQFTFTMCNPPFHSSAQEAEKGSLRKTQSLARHKKKYQGSQDKYANSKHQRLNFAGRSNELWCEGGESAFVQKMITESIQFSAQVQWFTTLISKRSNLEPIENLLAKANATEVKVISMGQGNKVSRFIAWRF